MNELIGRRLKVARENSGLTQAELAKLLDFNDRQTLTAIETGKRKINADELLRAINILGLDLDYFTDSYRLEGEGQFSWRASGDIEKNEIIQFEERASRWIATYKRLGEIQGEYTSPLEARLTLNAKSKFEDVRKAAESLAKEWELGEIPALKLEDSIFKNLNSLILYVDCPNEISGAACQIPGMNTILINRNELEGRRNYTLAHECFHLLTWEQMPPEYTDSDTSGNNKHKRVEQLANIFSSTLLMPEETLSSYWEESENKDIHRWLNDAASKLLVTAQAVKWRIVNLGWFSQKDLTGIDDNKLISNGRPEDKQSKPRLFCFSFVVRIHTAIEKGQLTIRRLAELLGFLIDDIASLFTSYELSVPFEI